MENCGNVTAFFQTPCRNVDTVWLSLQVQFHSMAQSFTPNCNAFGFYFEYYIFTPRTSNSNHKNLMLHTQRVWGTTETARRTWNGRKVGLGHLRRSKGEPCMAELTLCFWFLGKRRMARPERPSRNFWWFFGAGGLKTKRVRPSRTHERARRAEP